MNHEELISALEALIFASGEPLSQRDLRGVMQRALEQFPEDQRKVIEADINAALADLKARWSSGTRGFVLAEIGDALAFRSNPRFADVIRAMREVRPVRLSRAALETLSIVAYRQPVTKVEADHIRGVDCGGTLRLLLDRGLVRIVGKKEEPGRPLLYGTTKDFLSFFNLKGLSELPTLREFHELTEESIAELEEKEGTPTLEELSEVAKRLNLGEEPAVDELDHAVQGLDSTQATTAAAFAEAGIVVEPGAPLEDTKASA